MQYLGPEPTLVYPVSYEVCHIKLAAGKGWKVKGPHINDHLPWSSGFTQRGITSVQEDALQSGYLMTTGTAHLQFFTFTSGMLCPNTSPAISNSRWASGMEGKQDKQRGAAEMNHKHLPPLQRRTVFNIWQQQQMYLFHCHHTAVDHKGMSDICP